MSEVPFRILVVCVGNVCRSPLAERLLSARLQDLAADPKRFEVSSAGVRALVDRPIDEASGRQLRLLGGSGEGFRSRQLTEAIVADADLVLTATRDVRARVLEDSPAALRRSFTLREFAALAPVVEAGTPKQLVDEAARRRSMAVVNDYDVIDPIGAEDSVHEAVARTIDEATRAIATALASRT